MSRWRFLALKVPHKLRGKGKGGKLGQRKEDRKDTTEETSNHSYNSCQKCCKNLCFTVLPNGACCFQSGTPLHRWPGLWHQALLCWFCWMQQGFSLEDCKAVSPLVLLVRAARSTTQSASNHAAWLVGAGKNKKKKPNSRSEILHPLFPQKGNGLMPPTWKGVKNRFLPCFCRGCQGSGGPCFWELVIDFSFL